MQIVDGKEYIPQVRDLILEYADCLGERLIAALLQQAKKAGYREMVLDTILPLQAAIHLYRKMGFRECAPYYKNPMEDVVYFQKFL